LTVRARDALGNAASSVYKWTVDRTAPVVASTKLVGVVGPDPLVGLSANEPAKWIFSLDGGRIFDGMPSYMTLYSLLDGPHTLRTRAYDLAGNVSPIVTLSWTQETPEPVPSQPNSSGAPVVTIVQGPEGETSGGFAGFTFTSSGQDATFSCSLDGGGFAACTSPTVYEDLPMGQHAFAVEGRAGGLVSEVARRTWTIVA
jgi:hypothetical protein